MRERNYNSDYYERKNKEHFYPDDERIQALVVKEFPVLLKFAETNDVKNHEEWLSNHPASDHYLIIQKTLYVFQKQFNPVNLSQGTSLRLLEFFSSLFTRFYIRIERSRIEESKSQYINKAHSMSWMIQNLGELYDKICQKMPIDWNHSIFEYRTKVCVSSEAVDAILLFLHADTIPCIKWNNITKSLATLSKLNCLDGNLLNIDKIISGLMDRNNLQQNEFSDALGYILINIGMLKHKQNIPSEFRLKTTSLDLSIILSRSDIPQLLRIVYGLAQCATFMESDQRLLDFINKIFTRIESKEYTLSSNESANFLKNIGVLINNGCLGDVSHLPGLMTLVTNIQLNRTQDSRQGDISQAIYGVLLAKLDYPHLIPEADCLKLISLVNPLELKPAEAGRVLKAILLLKLPVDSNFKLSLNNVFAKQVTKPSMWQKDLQGKLEQYFKSNDINGTCEIEVPIGAWHVDFLIKLSLPNKKNIVFELDGMHHYATTSDAEDSLRNKDQLRDNWLESKRFEVVRIKNNEGETLKKMIKIISDALSPQTIISDTLSPQTVSVPTFFSPSSQPTNKTKQESPRFSPSSQPTNKTKQESPRFSPSSQPTNKMKQESPSSKPTRKK